MPKKPQVKPYHHPAGGWGALKAVQKAFTDQEIPLSGWPLILKMNKPGGFDCASCAWPDPKQPGPFEFCENGAKALAWEATRKRATRTSSRGIR